MLVEITELYGNVLGYRRADEKESLNGTPSASREQQE